MRAGARDVEVDQIRAGIRIGAQNCLPKRARAGIVGIDHGKRRHHLAGFEGFDPRTTDLARCASRGGTASVA